MLSADDLRKAMRRAFHLGQTYWMHADSDSFIQNQKADRVQAKLNELVEETVAAAAPADGVEAVGLPERRQLPEREGSTYFRALGWNECLDEIGRRTAGVHGTLNDQGENHG